jgi:hypothetical protein
MATKGHPRRDFAIARQLGSFALAFLLGVSACGQDTFLLRNSDGGDDGSATTVDGPPSIDEVAPCSQCGSSCVDLTTDPNNCGGCNNQCSAGQVCRGAQCGCAGNRALCGTAANATCVDLMADSANCGSCGNQCAANTTCNAGKCDCLGTEMLCGADVNATCTYLTNDHANCGACGNACPPGANCQNGACMCPAGLQTCGSSNTAICADTMTDHANCGGCGTPCASGSACVTGHCIPCTAMTTGKMCGTPPVCVDTSTDRANCGSCGKACLPSEICQSGICGCSADETLCGTGSSQACVVLSSDQNNCGACGNACKGGKLCQNSACVCPAGSHICSNSEGGTCVPDNSMSASSCGTTCAVCAVPSNGGATCSGTPPACLQSCPGDRPKLCGGGSNMWCANTTNDTGNCGSCGHQCSTNHAVPSCSNGNCSVACIQSFKDCDGNPDNGCETDTNGDANNCGMCGKRCSMTNGSASCVNGSCTIHCNFPWANCDHNSDTGCTVNTSNDNNNCGGCGHQCPSTSTCNNGNCVCPLNSMPCGNQCVSCPARPTNGSLTCSGDGRCVEACNNPNLPSLCGNACVNLQTDQSNCGGCGIPCVANNECDQTFTCQGGACKASNPKTCLPSDACHVAGCNPTTGCTETPKHCPPPTTCQSDGSCACSPPTILCGSSCVNPQGDKKKCGMCGEHCPGGGG